MADLGNLWFSLGLDDSKIEKQWKQAFDKYKNDAKINVDFKIDSKTIKELQKFKDAGFTAKEAKKYSNLAAATMKVAREQEKYNRELERTKALQNESNAKIARQDAESLKRQALTQEKINSYIEKRDKANERVTQGYKTQSLWMQNLKTLAENYFSLYAVRNFVTELARMSGEFEKQRVTLQAMVGEMQGLEIYGKMKELAVVSPFEFKDLASYTKQLAAFSVPYEELYDTTKRLADVSAGLGVDMSRIILAYGQIKSAGVLKGTELRQLTEAGVPVLEKLADKFTQLEGKAVSIGDVFGKISQKLVPFEMVKDVFTELTSEGGKFYNMQEIQAETLAGKISNLKDAYFIMLSEIGEMGGDWLKENVNLLYKAIDNWEVLGRTIFAVFNAFGIYQTVRVLQWLASLNLGVTEIIPKFKELYNQARKTEGVIKSLLSAFSGTKGIGLVAAAIGGLVAGLIQLHRASKQAERELREIINIEIGSLNREIDALDNLTNAIYNTTEGTENRRIAIEAYNNRFGSYLQNLYDEKTALDAIANGNESVLTSMKNRYREEAELQARNKIKEQYDKDLNTWETQYISRLNQIGLKQQSSYALAAVQKALENNPDATLMDLREELEKRLSPDAVSGAFKQVSQFFGEYKRLYKNFNNALQQALQDIDNSFKVTEYSSWQIEQDYKKFTEEYQRDLEKARDNSKLTSGQVLEAERNAEIKYLNKLIVLYKNMPIKLKQTEERLDKLTKKHSDWADDIRKIFNDKGIAAGFAPKVDEDYLTYLNRVREDYKDIKKSLQDLEKVDPNGVKPALEARKAVYEHLEDKWGVSLDAKGDAKTAKEQEKERVNALKDEYNWLLKVYDAYKNYINQDMSAESAKKAVSTDFMDIPESIKKALEGDTDFSDWFRTEMQRLSEEAAKGGSNIGEALAIAILQKLGVINAKEVLSAMKLGEQIKEELAKWGMEDFALKGKGVTLDISKALQAQTIADNQAFARRKELLDKIAKAEKGNETEIAALRKEYGDNWLEEAKNRANELYELEIANNKKIAEDKISELGKSYTKEAQEIEFSPDFFSNLGEKTLTQLKEASAKLQEMIATPSFLMDVDYLDKIASGELLQEQVDKHIEQWKEYFSLLKGDTDVQHFEKVKQAVVDAGKALSDVINSFKQLADGDSVLGGLLDGLGAAVDTATNIAGAFEKKVEYDKEGNKLTESISLNWGSIASAAASVVSSVISNIIAAKQYRDEMEKAADSFQTSITASRRELKIAGEEFDTIFGENVIGALQADSEAISEITRELRTASSEVSKMKVTTRKGFFGIGVKQTTLKDLAPQLFNADGSVNYDYLDEFLDAYGDKLSDSQKTLLENLKNTYEQYQDAMADTTEYLKGIFSDTASTIADRMIESFALTGDAATELGDLVNGVAKQMAKDLIQSLLVEQYLTPAMDRIKALYEPTDKAYEEDSAMRTQKAILAMQDAINAAGQAVPEVNKLLEALQAMGIDLNADSENASEVLSGLTEDQQNLLVSYINAIRADVSANKGLLTSIVNSVGTINNNIATAIVVWTQIEANTRRNADGVDRIIGFFESVMGPYDGGAGQAFQVNIA